MPVKKWNNKGAGTPVEHIIRLPNVPIQLNGVSLGVPSKPLNGTPNRLDRHLLVPPPPRNNSGSPSNNGKLPSLEAERHAHHHRSTSLNRDQASVHKNNHIRAPSAAPRLGGRSPNDFRREASTSPQSEGVSCGTNSNNLKRGQKDGCANLSSPNGEVPANNKSCTINLQPGHYKVNIEWRSASKPFLITFTPSKDKGEGRGNPPLEPEPLLYGETPPPSPLPSVSLPRRIVQKMIRSPIPRGNSGGLLELPGTGLGSKEQRQGKQRKGKHRWASLSCIHMSNLDDSLSETSGCDSFAGYEGVEHLKRSSVGGHVPDNDIIEEGLSGAESGGRFNVREGSCSIGGCSLHSSTEISGRFNFADKAHLPLYTVSCEAIVNPHMTSCHAEEAQANGRRTWHEDEAFLKQVVDEYFSETSDDIGVPTSAAVSAPAPVPSNLAFRDINSGKIKMGIVKSTSDCFLSHRKSPMANIIPLQASSKLSSSCIGLITKTCSLLETVSEGKMSSRERGILNEEHSSFDETLVGDDVDTCSGGSDDSSGYEADTEPGSDKEAYGGIMFWREWMSAPDVSKASPSYAAGQHPIEQGDGSPITNSAVTPPSGGGFNYGPRKSSSSGDAHKLSKSFVCVQKFRAHKLKRFLDDVNGEKKDAGSRNVKRIDENYVYEDCPLTAADDPSLVLNSPRINLEFINTKFALQDRLEVLSDTVGSGKKSDLSFDDLEFTRKALSEGLVITQSARGESADSKCEPELLSDRQNSSQCEASEHLSCRSKSCDSIGEQRSVKSDHHQPIYYNVRSFYAKNRNIKNVSKRRRGELKHLNGDIWQPEEIPCSDCISTEIFSSSLQHSHGSSEDIMACSPSLERNSSSYRSTPSDVSRPVVINGGTPGQRVQEDRGGTKLQWSGARPETMLRSELHVLPPAVLFESVNKKQQSMPHSAGKSNSPLQRVPLPTHKPNKVSNYIMGNVQPSIKESSSSSFGTEDSDKDKIPKKKSASKIKTKKTFNTFLGSFGAAGALAKNSSKESSVLSDTKKPNLFATSSSNGEKLKDNCIATDKQRGPTSALLLSGSQCHHRPTKNIGSANYSPVRRKAIKKECKNDTEEKSGSSCSDDSVSAGSASITNKSVTRDGGADAGLEHEADDSQPIYENALFHRQRYVGKFSYINSLIQASETEDKSTASDPPLNDVVRSPKLDSPPVAPPAVTTNWSSNLDVSFSPLIISHASRPLHASESPISSARHRSPPGEKKALEKGEHLPLIPQLSPQKEDPKDLYEDFVSARGSRNSLSIPFPDGDEDEEDCSDDTTEGGDDSDGGNSVAKVSMSSESVASDASSFYYTAGGSTIYDAVEAVTEYFSMENKKEFSSSTAGVTDAQKKYPAVNIGTLPNDRGKDKTGFSGSNIFPSEECLENDLVKKFPDVKKSSEKEPKANSHDYVNARVVVTDEDKILIDLRPTSEERVVISDLLKKEATAEGADREAKKLSKIDPNKINSENKNSLFENNIKINYDDISKIKKANHDERENLINNKNLIKKENKNKFHAKLGLENESVSLADVNYSSTVLRAEEDLPSVNNNYDAEGVVHASPCVAVSSDDEATHIYINDSEGNYEPIPSLHTNFDGERGVGEAGTEGSVDLEQEDLLESYYSQLAREKKKMSLPSGRPGSKLEEEDDLLTTEPEVSSLYAQTTFSDSPGNSESHRTMGEYRNSPFSSSEGISENSGGSEAYLDQQSFARSNNNNDSGSSLSCDGNCDQPPRKNIFRVPLSGPAFPHRRHTFQFVPSSSSEHNSHGFYAQRRSNPDLPPGLGPPWNLSPTSPVDAKKPPRSPSHRGRDSSSVPREGRSGIQMRRRCRSVSSGSSVDTSKDGGDLAHPQHPRPSSLISISRGQASSSQESLHDLPSFRFSPAAGDKAPNIRWLAERKKHDGNECYKAKEYRDALKLYTEAVELCPECAPYYSNRSACYMMLGKYAQALSDAREAVRLDSTFVKGYLRIAKCNIALGDANAALAVLRQASELDPGNKSIREEENNAQALMKCTEDADKAAFRKDYRMAIFHIDRALTLAAGCRSLKITKAEYLIFLHRYGDAQEIVNEILQFDSGNADAIYVRGMCLYYQNNHEAAFTHFQHVLRLAPDHKKAKDVYKKAKLLRQKKDEGNQAFNRGNLQGALTTYTEALAVDPNNVSTNSKLYCNRATVRAKLRNFEEAVDDCTAAINLDESYIKAYLRRAKCYQELEKHEEAVRDYEKVCKLDRNQENKRLLQEAKTLLKRSKWKDYYKILGVTKTASEDEIKKSYKKMALQHHPDRHASASDKEKHEHEVKFKEIGEAYTVLTDTKKKAMYDRGQDVNESDCGMFHDEVDPNQIFQAFFSQGGNNAFSFGGNGGFPGAGFSGGNFPGGFHFQFS